MFTNVGWTEILVIGVVALVVLGPERLPDAARWIGGAMRKVRDFAGSAQEQLKNDYGSDFEEFREPIKQINELRGLSPRAVVTKHLLDGDDSLFTGDFGAATPSGGAAAGAAASARPAPTPTARESTPAGAAPSAMPGAAGSGATTTPSTRPAGDPVWDTDAT